VPANPARPTTEPDEVVEGGELLRQSSSGLTEAELERAAQLEAEANARERAAIADSLRRRNRDRDAHLVDTGDLNAPLSVRAAKEYAYVARDVRRIAVTAALMVGILAVLYIVLNVLSGGTV